MTVDVKAVIRQARAEAAESWPHYVYRCYDAAGVLLYVGCTQDVEARMAVHRSAWSNPASAYLSLHMARYETTEYMGLRAARAAEKATIAAKAPLLNIHHNNGRGAERLHFEQLEDV